MVWRTRKNGLNFTASLRFGPEPHPPPRNDCRLRFRVIEMEVSFIVPARNEQIHLPSCIGAIRETMRTKAAYEIIVVDDHSEDDTPQVAQDQGCMVVHNKDKGPAAARNAGASVAKGRFIAFVDADCLLSPDWYESISAHFGDPKVVAAGAKISPDFRNSTWVERTEFLLNKRRGTIKSETALQVKWLGTSNILMRKLHFEKAGGFNAALSTCEDFDICERLAKIGEIILDRKIYTVHSRESKTLRELFRRELWRGQDSLIHWIRSGYNLYEAPSLLLPFCFLLFLALGVFLIPFSAQTGFLLLLFAFACPALLVLRAMQLKSGAANLLCGLITSATYLLARGIAIILEPSYGKLLSLVAGSRFIRIFTQDRGP